MVLARTGADNVADLFDASDTVGNRGRDDMRKSSDSYCMIRVR